MKQLTILLIIILGVFAQEEKHIEKIKKSFQDAVTSKEVENVLDNLQNLQNKNVEEIRLIMNLLWEYQQFIFDDKHRKVMSEVLCPIILEILDEKKDNDFQILMSKILSLLDTEILLSHKKTLYQLINISLVNKTLLAGNFFEYFVLKKNGSFPEIAALVIKEERRFFHEPFYKVVGQIFFKYDSDLFWENVVKILKQNSKETNFQIIFGFQYCLDIKPIKTVQMLIKIFYNSDLKEVNDITLLSLQDIFDDGFVKYLTFHKKTLENDPLPIFELFALSDTTMRKCDLCHRRKTTNSDNRTSTSYRR